MTSLRLYPRLLCSSRRQRALTMTASNHCRSQSPLPSSWHHDHGHCDHHHHTNIREIVTSSTAPSPDVFIERPEAIVLMESSLYQHSWEEYCTKFYPSHGLHFASIDIMQQSRSQNKQQKGLASSKQRKKKTTSNNNDTLSLKSLERNMANDLTRLGEVASNIGDSEFFIEGHAPIMSTSAYSILIARGPLQCLVAQYFLESSPLAGLVMVDPLLLPADGRSGKNQQQRGQKQEGGGGGFDESRWETSLSDLIALLENREPHMYKNNGGMVDNGSGGRPSSPPLILPNGVTMQQSPNEATTGSTSLELEIALLQSLASNNKRARPLMLESGSVPILVLYSGGNHPYHDHYRLCSERTAAFHTCGGKGDYFDQVSVLRIPRKKTKNGGSGDNNMQEVDDLDVTMRKIYEWYDEVVA